jgi:hypothetical protein
LRDFIPSNPPVHPPRRRPHLRHLVPRRRVSAHRGDVRTFAGIDGPEWQRDIGNSCPKSSRPKARSSTCVHRRWVFQRQGRGIFDENRTSDRQEIETSPLILPRVRGGEGNAVRIHLWLAGAEWCHPAAGCLVLGAVDPATGSFLPGSAPRLPPPQRKLTIDLSLCIPLPHGRFARRGQPRLGKVKRRNRDSATRPARRWAVQPDVGELSCPTGGVPSRGHLRAANKDTLGNPLWRPGKPTRCPHHSRWHPACLGRRVWSSFPGTMGLEVCAVRQRCPAWTGGFSGD